MRRSARFFHKGFLVSAAVFILAHQYPSSSMKNAFTFTAFGLALLFCGCRKAGTVEEPAAAETASPAFKEYIIPQGEHYATDNPLKPLQLSELKFTVKFDSSAVYQTADTENQYDINKLYGFADNGEYHQQYSARFGWRWSDGALRLFAYTYNNGVRDSKELGTVAIDKEVFCCIKVTGETYVFTLNDKTATMPRLSVTEKVQGYQLYPYFGGDETAPHEVRIWIREEK